MFSFDCLVYSGLLCTNSLHGPLESNMDSTDTGEINKLMEALKLVSQKVADLKADIQTKTSESADDGVLNPLKEELQTAVADESTVREALFAEWAKVRQGTVSSNESGNKTESLSTSDSHTASDRNPATSSKSRNETPLTARFSAPKEYKHGENFTTWCSRFRRYLRASRLERDDAFELLLNHVDDRTLETLEPVADRLTLAEGRDPDVFIPIFEQAIYPKSDIRSLRQQLTNGNLVQEESEDVDTFASRIRSLAKRAYNNPPDRHEPCLNAFLNGMRDERLFDKVISVPGAEDDFDLAVESARKFEKLRRTNRSRTTEHEKLDVLRVSNSTENEVREEPPQRRSFNTRQGPQNYGNNTNNRRNVENERPANRSHHRGRNAGRSDNRSERRTCLLCHERGHIVSNCPLNPLNGNRAGDLPSTGPSQ